MRRIREIDIPQYSAREERLNTATHIFGAAFAVWVLVYGLKLARLHGRELAVESCWIYGLSMLILYLVSSVYHSLPVGNAKRVMRIVDHCTIYALIAGSYTPTLLVAIRPQHPTLAWVIFSFLYGGRGALRDRKEKTLFPYGVSCLRCPGQHAAGGLYSSVCFVTGTIDFDT